MLPEIAGAQDVPPETEADSAAVVVARADSIRAAMAMVRPPNEHPTDVADLVAVPFRIVGAPLHFVLVYVPSWAIGQITLPRPPGILARAVTALGEAGFHPGIATSIGPRSGIAATLRYDALEPVVADAAFSLHGSQRYRLRTRLESDRVAAQGGASWRRWAQVPFYGIGARSPNRRSLYRREIFALELTSLFRVAPALVLEADVGYEDNLVLEPVWAGDEPTLFEQVGDLPFGADRRLRFVRLGAGAELDLTRRVAFQDRGVRFLAGGTRYEGVDGTRAAFHRLRFEAEGLVPLNARQLLALQAQSRLTRGGPGPIPFYHLARLGGEETALGFPDSRFTDNDMVSLTAEWRYEIWRDIHNTLRAESFLYFGEGAVGRRLGDISSGDWHASYGFGFRVARLDELLGLVYLGFSAESVTFGASGEWAP